MSVDYSLLPKYTPKIHQYDPGWIPFEFENIQEDPRGVRQVEIQLCDFSSKLLPSLEYHGIGKALLTIKDKRVAHMTVAPRGYAYVSIDSEKYSKSLEEEIIARVSPGMIEVRYPTQVQWEQLKKNGYGLTTDFVRWFAQVGAENDPFSFLSGKRKKRVRQNVKKAVGITSIVELLTTENFARWLPIYEQEIVGRPGGIRIFYCDLFSAGKNMDGMLMISCFMGDEYLGGSIVNTWGAFADAKLKTRKYTSFLMSATSQAAKQFGLGYLLDKEVMSIARGYGDVVYGHGGDFPVWGLETSVGLLTRKSAVGMYMFPHLGVRALRLFHDVLSQHATQYCAAWLNEHHQFCAEYFNRRAVGWIGAADELYPPPWENAGMVVDSSAYWYIKWYGGGAVDCSVPDGVRLGK